MLAPSSTQLRHNVVVALGGNAILQPGQVGTFEEQLFNIDGAMRRIAALAADGWRVVRGNGPQFDNLLIRNALAARTVAPIPMGACGAESQGQIGCMAAQTLANHLRKPKIGGAKAGIDLGEVQDAVELASALPHIAAIGAHYHLGSQVTELEPYELAINRALNLLPWLEGALGHSLEHLNVGRGLAIPYIDSQSTFRSYFEAPHRFEDHAAALCPPCAS